MKNTTKDDARITAAGAAIGAGLVAVAELVRRFSKSSDDAAYAEMRRRLAETLDRLRDARDGNDALRATIAEYGNAIAERDRTIATLREERAQCDATVLSLIKSLNSANVLCSDMRSQLARSGHEVQGGYFMAVLPDGSVAGPFSRS